jgi:two-component sensor histidine kinase
MRQLDGQGILQDTKTPSVRWLDVYIEDEDRPGVFEAIDRAVSSKQTFEYEHRVKLPDGGHGWVHSRAVPIFDERGLIVEWFGAASDITSRKQAEAQQEVLTHEIGHRLKNILAVVQSVASQTIKTAPDLESAQKALASRLEALARAQDILLTGSAVTTDLQGVIDSTIHQHDDGSGRITASGPFIEIDPAAALNLSLTFHELATNALKYGALREPGGRVTVKWSIEGDDLCLRWQEAGGPIVTPPERKGFGSKLIERSLVGGQATVHYDSGGIVFDLRAPIRNLFIDRP